MGSITLTNAKRFWDFVSTGLGPAIARWLAKHNAEAYAKRLPIEVDATVSAIEELEDSGFEMQGTVTLPSLQAAFKRSAEHEAQRQMRNTVQIVQKAIPLLPATLPDVPVDPDIAAQFFEAARNVSNEDLQAIWAKLLAREISEPNSISPRTIERVRVIARTEAERFNIAASILVDNVILRADEYRKRLKPERHAARIKVSTQPELEPYYEQIGLSFVALKSLEDSGLIIAESDIIVRADLSDQEDKSPVLSFGPCLVYCDDTSKASLEVPCYMLTSSGQELASALNVPFRTDAIEVFTAIFTRAGLRVARDESSTTK